MNTAALPPKSSPVSENKGIGNNNNINNNGNVNNHHAAGAAAVKEAETASVSPQVKVCSFEPCLRSLS